MGLDSRFLPWSGEVFSIIFLFPGDDGEHAVTEGDVAAIGERGLADGGQEGDVLHPPVPNAGAE